ncbi:MAG: VOC family protein [Proteobacteria bacterium]|nr:VOC family protein [Pseudomonadota bacterium]
MVNKIEHIGIIVKDLEASIAKWKALLGLELKEVEALDVEGVVNKVAFFPVGPTNIELVYTTAETGLAAEFLKERGESIHHIAFEVEDVEKVFNELRSRGVRFVWDKVINGSRGSRVAFFQPEELNGIYVELVQKH